jgi:hypothetical protein
MKIFLITTAAVASLLFTFQSRDDKLRWSRSIAVLADTGPVVKTDDGYRLADG